MFDQGLLLHYAFNHAEAVRSFKTAVILDGTLAIAHAGAALSLGPNVNAAMDPEDNPKALEQIALAKQKMAGASARERAYIEAIATRYGPDVAKRKEYDEAYASAMRSLVKQYPFDADAWTLLAEALMVLHPWDYWTKEGEPKPWAPEMLEAAEAALRLNPGHPGANHLYIHIVEASKNPERGLAAAMRLGDAMPGAGHMVHMPSHIYIRTGLYHEASLANERAIAADDAYFAACRAQGIYAIGYRPHNHHFLWATATVEGRSEKAIMAAKHMASLMDQQLMRQPGMGTMQHFWITPLYAHVRFGKWDEVRRTPEPAADLLYPRAVWHYAQGIAAVRDGGMAKAQEHLDALIKIANDEAALRGITFWDINTAYDVLQVALQSLACEVAIARADWDAAVNHGRKAVEAEHNLNYDEPPPWHQSANLVLGTALLAAKRFTEAEEAFRADLQKYPFNGWGLTGLALALDSQGKNFEATQVRSQIDVAWRNADVKLTGPTF